MYGSQSTKLLVRRVIGEIRSIVTNWYVVDSGADALDLSDGGFLGFSILM